MRIVEAVVENGLVRPLEALDAADGTRVQVTVPSEAADGDSQPVYSPGTDVRQLSSERLEADRKAVEAILARPLPDAEPFSGEDHDEELYGWKRTGP